MGACVRKSEAETTATMCADREYGCVRKKVGG
jgi:hypothetical protein